MAAGHVISRGRIKNHLRTAGDKNVGVPEALLRIRRTRVGRREEQGKGCEDTKVQGNEHMGEDQRLKSHSFEPFSMSKT